MVMGTLSQMLAGTQGMNPNDDVKRGWAKFLQEGMTNGVGALSSVAQAATKSIEGAEQGFGLV